jgi:PBSX family phage terminase large subunit
MKLTPAQATIAKDKHRFRVLNCGRRFGKTILAVEEMVGVAIKEKDRRVVYYAPTRDDARDITWAILVRKCENITAYKNESLLQLRIMTMDGGESMIVLHGWESVQERGKGRGLANDFIVCDEVSSYRNFWMGWDEVLSPTLIDRKGSAMFISTPKGFNHFYDLYGMEAKDSNYKSFHFSTYDNPYIPVEEIEREKATKPENTFAQEYMADFRKQEGLVYKEFQRDRHVKSMAIDNPTEFLAGIDFGFTNPTAVIPLYRFGDEQYHVPFEWYRTGRTEEQVGEYVKSCSFNRVYPDPERPSAIEVLNVKGVEVVEVIKNKDSIMNGINRVRSLLKQGKLTIDPSCVNLINEFETYAYPEKRPDNNVNENPIKEHDHALDALRYALSTNRADNVISPEMRARNYMESQRNIHRSSR